jgi:hypothetical protein
MWLIARYEMVSLFSLKLSSATASGGKTLLAPTPYAMKMALVDCACRILGINEARRHWPLICNLRVALHPAKQVVVSNLFQRVLRPRRNPASTGDPDTGPFQRTIGYREYAQLIGPLEIGLGWEGEEPVSWLNDLLMNLNYLGKRGSFIQLLEPPSLETDIPVGFIELTREQHSFLANGTLQLLDDCAHDLPFEKIDIYSGIRLKTGIDRIVRSIVLPYRMARSSKSFTLYERLESS